MNSICYKKSNLASANIIEFFAHAKMALTKMTEYWLSEMDSGNLTGIVLLDFSKAFGLVNHSILLHKLKVYKFSEQTLTLLKSYLLGRTQEVRIGKFNSEKRNILAGVPTRFRSRTSFIYTLH